MTTKTQAAGDDRKGEAPEEAWGFALADLWRAPLMVLAHLIAFFSGEIETLRAMRRRPLPKAWRQAIPGLITGEWYIRDAITEGVETLLAGENLDIASLLNVEIAFIPAMPADLHIPEPKSAWETHRRFEAIARFYADPETFIRRAAQRIAGATARLVHGPKVDPIAPGALASSSDETTATPMLFSLLKPHPAERIGGPPSAPL